MRTDLLDEVRAIRVVALAAATGDQGARQWLTERFDGLASLLGRVEAEISKRITKRRKTAKKSVGHERVT